MSSQKTFNLYYLQYINNIIESLNTGAIQPPSWTYQVVFPVNEPISYEVEFSEELPAIHSSTVVCVNFIRGKNEWYISDFEIKN